MRNNLRGKVPSLSRLSSSTLPGNKAVVIDDFIHIMVSMSLSYADDGLGTQARVTVCAHLLELVLALIPQPRDAEAGADAEDLDAVLLELELPIDHEHAQRSLAAAVADGLELDLLGPAGGLGRRREVALGSGSQLRETSDEDDARIGGLEQQRHKGPGHDVRAGYVDVVGAGEGLAETGLAELVVIVKGSTWVMQVSNRDSASFGIEEHSLCLILLTGVVDEKVQAAVAVADGLGSSLNGVVGFDVNQEQRNSVGGVWNLGFESFNRLIAARLGSGSEEDMIRVGRLVKDLGRLEANTSSRAGDEDSLWSHC